jgi:hypothetical protein
MNPLRAESATRAWDDVLAGLRAMPNELEATLRVFPAAPLVWQPESWGGSPAENFSALGHARHLRDIEADGYHVRIRRLLEESGPSLISIDGYELAAARRYHEADLSLALRAFGESRRTTIDMLRGLSPAQLDRTGTFAEYSRLTLRALVHYLRSHDQQHLSGLQWLLGKMASSGALPA